jgi:hypothetical protein
MTPQTMKMESPLSISSPQWEENYACRNKIRRLTSIRPSYISAGNLYQYDEKRFRLKSYLITPFSL